MSQARIPTFPQVGREQGSVVPAQAGIQGIRCAKAATPAAFFHAAALRGPYLHHDRPPRGGPAGEKTVNVVLVPIDGSASAYRALSLALKELGGASASRLHILNVQPPSASEAAAPDASAAAARERGIAVLTQAEGMAQGAHRRVESHVRIGRPAEQILACAHELGCDFVIMGTRGLTAAAAATLGSVALDVARQSRIPVTLVR